MKKLPLWLGIVGIITCLVTPHIISALVLFLLMGIVPGTDISLPSWAMLALYATIGGITILLLGLRRVATRTINYRRLLPVRRYSQI